MGNAMPNLEHLEIDLWLNKLSLETILLSFKKLKLLSILPANNAPTAITLNEIDFDNKCLEKLFLMNDNIQLDYSSFETISRSFPNLRQLLASSIEDLNRINDLLYNSLQNLYYLEVNGITRNR